jgi:peptidoglycan/xylan/chitin deacetylase (PgdA/CDA1 family)
MVHRVVQGGADAFGFYRDTATSPAELERYLEARSGWRPVPHQRLFERAEGEAYLLTCDDGYRSFATAVLPLLERFEAHCLLFVTTGFISGDHSPYEMVLADHLAAAEELEIPGRGRVLLKEDAHREELYRELRLALKPASTAGRREFLSSFLDANGLQRSRSRSDEFLSWEELRELSGHPLVAIGAHTVSHPLLTAITWRESLAELRLSKREIESRTGIGVEAVAYPYGGHSRVVRVMARLAGFRLGFTTRPGTIEGGAAADRLALPRNELGGGGA